MFFQYILLIIPTYVYLSYIVSAGLVPEYFYRVLLVLLVKNYNTSPLQGNLVLPRVMKSFPGSGDKSYSLQHVPVLGKYISSLQNSMVF